MHACLQRTFAESDAMLALRYPKRADTIEHSVIVWLTLYERYFSAVRLRDATANPGTKAL